MTSATSSLENQHGNGRLKLKIKFSKSKGFVSDFVDGPASHADPHAHKLSCATLSEPAPRSEPLSFPQHTHVVSSPASPSELQPASQRTHIASSPIGKLNFPNNPVTLHQLESGGSTTDSVDLNDCPEIISRKVLKDQVCDQRKNDSVPYSVHSSLDINSCYAREKNGEQQALCHEETKKQLCPNSKPKFTDLPGVNYGKVLQDLQFLSTQQEEPDGRDASLVHVQEERHLTSVSSAACVQKHNQGVVEPGTDTEEKAGMADGEDTTEEEPMSPFDIDCSLGLADEHFSFTGSTQGPAAKQNNGKGMKENPLFPWSVDDLTDSETQCASLMPLSSRQTQPQNGSQVTEASAMKNTLCGSSHQLVTTSVRDFLDKAVVVAYQHGTVSRSRIGDEINNNGNASLLRGSRCTFANRPDHTSGSMLIPQSVAFVPVKGLLNSCANLSFVSAADNTHTSTTNAESENPQALIHRKLSLDSVVGSQGIQSSVKNRHLSGFESDMGRCSSSVLCKWPSLDSVVDGRTDNKNLATSALQPPVPQCIEQKECDGKKNKNDLLVKLLTSEVKVHRAMNPSCCADEQTSLSRVFGQSMRQSAENPSSIQPFPAPLTSPIAQSQTQAVDANPATPVTSIQLNRTIDELRKRVTDQVVADGLSGTSQEGMSSGQAGGSKCHSSSANQAKRAKSPKWCRCEKPEFYVHSETNVTSSHLVNSADVNVSGEKICKNCQKKPRSKQRKKRLPIWCRCDSPNPYTPDGMVSVMCRHCLKRVSKQWRKRAAAKWCKCHTPVLCTVRLANDQDENTSSKVNICRRCYKWISKDREDVCMKGDQFGQISGTSILHAAGLQPLMTDHNYSLSPFSPSALAKRPAPASVPVVPQTTQEQSEVLQGNGLQNISSQSGAQVTPGPKKLVYVYPRSSTSVPSASSSQPCSSDGGMNLLRLLNPPLVSPKPMALDSAGATSSSSGCVLSSSGSILYSRPPSAVSLLCAASKKIIARRNRPKKAQCVEPAVSMLTERKLGERSTSATFSSRPAWIQGVSQDLLQPCYVVMETLEKESLCRHTPLVPAGPCSLSCRENFLNVTCRQGDLKQCGHSLEHDRSDSGECADLVAVRNRKRDYFRHNKTMVGFEEMEEQECQEESLSSGATEGTNNLSSAGFVPLSSASPDGFTNIRITAQNAVNVQRMSETFTQNSDQLQDACRVDRPGHSSVASSKVLVRSSQETKQKAGEMTEQCDQANVAQQDRNPWLKRSKFSVKYYVFGAHNRAFIVPLIQNKRCARAAPQLDEEDMGYVRKAIDELLLEKDSCARHLKYPDSLQHKEPDRTIGQCVNKKTFVAPTLGGEDLDIEGLKSLISDGDFSRLVPRNTRISKSRYLQEIGEKVHMYLTGGSEETPEWIKDVAKSIVMKHRKRGKSKTRLRPSKNVSIEIDYAHEEESLEIEDSVMSPSHASVGESVSSTTGSHTALLSAETADQSNDCDPSYVPQEVHTPKPIGSYVIAEAFAQEEKKPVIQNVLEAVQGSNVWAADGTVPQPGQQILVPLPESCTDDQESSISLSYTVHQQHLDELQVGEECQDKKPLLGELLAAASMFPLRSSVEGIEASSGHDQSEQQHEHNPVTTSQQCQCADQPPTWPRAYIKEEPPDEDYSHAWPNQGETEGMGQPPIAEQNTERPDTIPFISNSTFGRGAVHIDDEEGSAAPNVDQNQDTGSGMEVSCIKMEPCDAESGTAVGAPLITCIASGELAAMLTKSDPSETSQSVCIADGKAVPCSIDAQPHGMISSAAEMAAFTDQPASDYLSPDEKKSCSNLEAHKDGQTFGELICRSIDNNVHELFKNTDCGAGSPCEQTQIIIMPESLSLPQISAVSFGEAAKLWQTEDKQSATSSKMSEYMDSCLTETESIPAVVPVLSSVLCGETVQCTEDSEVLGESEVPAEQQTTSPEEYNEEYSEDFQDDDDYFEEDDDQSDLKPIVMGEGQILSIPIVFPSDSTPEAREHHPLNVPQVCVDMSVVKHEPPDDGDSSALIMNSVTTERNVVLPTAEHASVNPTEESSPVPSILEVRSLAAMKLPFYSERDTVDTPEAARELQNYSSVSSSSLEAKSLESVKVSDHYSSKDRLSPSAATDVNCDVLDLLETEREEDSQNCEDEKSGSQENRDSVCVKPVVTKTKSRRRNRKSSGKRRRQHNRPASMTLPESKQRFNKADNPSPVENKGSAAENVDSFIPPPSALPCFSANQVSLPTEKAGEPEENNVPTKLDVAQSSSTISNITSKKTVVTFSELTPSDTRLAGQKALDKETVLLESDVSLTRNIYPTGRNGFPDNFVPARNSLEPVEKDDTFILCRDKIQTCSTICMEVSADSAAESLTAATGETGLPKKDCQFYMKDSQPENKDAAPKDDQTTTFAGNAAEDTDVTESYKNTQNVSSASTNKTLSDRCVLLSHDISQKLTSRGEDVPTESVSRQNCPVPTLTETLEKDDTSLNVQDNSGELQDSFPITSQLQDSMDLLSTHSSDVQELQGTNNLAAAVTDQGNTDVEQRTAVVTCETALLETEHYDTFQNVCDTKTNNVVEDVTGVSGTRKTKTSERKRRARSKSKGKKKNRVKPGKWSVPTLSEHSPNRAVSNSQDTALITGDKHVPSFQAVSSEKDSPVLTLRIPRSLRSSAKCLSENQVSSTCDGPVSRRLDVLDSDPNSEEHVGSDRKDDGKHERKAPFEVVQPLQDIQSSVTAHSTEFDSIDEGAHYVSQIFEGRGKEGGTCLVLRKKRPVQSSPVPPATNLSPSGSVIIGHVHKRMKEKDVPEPAKKLKMDYVRCKPSLSKAENQPSAECAGSKGLKRKCDDLSLDAKCGKSIKVPKSERSIFSDMSAVLSSIAGSSSDSVSTTLSESCSSKASSGETKVLPDAVIKVAEKGFNKNIFSCLRASLVSVTDSTTVVKRDGNGRGSPSAVSSAPSQNFRERSFFDCLPQGFVDAWKNK